MFAVTAPETHSHLQLGLCLTSPQVPPWASSHGMSGYRFVPRDGHDDGNVNCGKGGGGNIVTICYCNVLRMLMTLVTVTTIPYF